MKKHRTKDKFKPQHVQLQYVHGTLLIAMLTNETIQDMLQQLAENSSPEDHMMTKGSNTHENKITFNEIIIVLLYKS